MTAEGKIYQAIPAIMGELDAIGKTKRNAQQGFLYRGIDDVMNALNPALVRNKVFIVPEVIDQTREERTTAKGSTLIYSICRMRFRFYAEDGSFVEAVTVGEGMDSGDKATNKAMAIAFKYACFQAFCIPTEEMKDPDAESHEVRPRAGGQQDAGRRSGNPPASGGGHQYTDRQMAEMAERMGNEQIDEIREKDIRDKIRRKGISGASVLNHYGLPDFAHMTVRQYDSAMEILNNKPDKRSGAQ